MEFEMTPVDIGYALLDFTFLFEKNFNEVIKDYDCFSDVFIDPATLGEGPSTLNRVEAIICSGNFNDFRLGLQEMFPGFFERKFVPTLLAPMSPDKFMVTFTQYRHIVLRLSEYMENTLQRIHDEMVADHGISMLFDITGFVHLLTYPHFKTRLQAVVFEALQTLRSTHPYSSTEKYESFITRKLHPVKSFIIETGHTCLYQSWHTLMFEKGMESVRQHFLGLRDCSAKSFLATARMCIALEVQIIGFFPGENDANTMPVRSSIRKVICQEWLNRSKSDSNANSLSNVLELADFTSDRDEKIENVMASDLLNLYLFRDDDMKILIEDLIKTVNKNVDSLLLLAFDVTECSDWRLLEFVPLLQKLWKYEELLEERFTSTIAKCEDMAEVIAVASRNRFEAISETSALTKILDAQELVRAFLCSTEDIGNYSWTGKKDWRNIGKFFKYLADQGFLMRELLCFVKMYRNFAPGCLNKVRRFVELADVQRHVPHSLRVLLEFN